VHAPRESKKLVPWMAYSFVICARVDKYPDGLLALALPRIVRNGSPSLPPL
jgi:hypothetical protein